MLEDMLEGWFLDGSVGHRPGPHIRNVLRHQHAITCTLPWILNTQFWMIQELSRNKTICYIREYLSRPLSIKGIRNRGIRNGLFHFPYQQPTCELHVGKISPDSSLMNCGCSWRFEPLSVHFWADVSSFNLLTTSRV